MTITQHNSVLHAFSVPNWSEICGVVDVLTVPRLSPIGKFRSIYAKMWSKELDIYIYIYISPGADPGFEVRGCANGFENSESREEGGICKNIRLLQYIYIFQIRCVSCTLFIAILYISSPLYNIVMKNRIWKNFMGGARPVRPPLNPPLITLSIIDTDFLYR